MLRRDPSMKKFISLTVLLLVLFLFVPALFAQVQQKQTPIIQPKPGDAPVTVFIAGDYFGQNFADVNTIYQSIEKNYSLPAGSDFKNYYFVMAGVRYTPTIGQSIQGGIRRKRLESRQRELHQFYAIVLQRWIVYPEDTDADAFHLWEAEDWGISG